MLGVTLFGIFLTPVFFYVISWLTDGKKPKQPEPAAESRNPAKHGRSL